MPLRGSKLSTAAVSVLAMSAALVISGCSSASAPTAKTTASTAPKTGLIICVCGPTSDAFFGAVKAGSDQAAKDLHLTYEYSAAANENNLAADGVNLIKEAIAAKPAALVIGDYIPSAYDPYIKEATAQGIPVVINSVGLDNWKSDGAIGFVGEDPALMGSETADDQINAGAKSGMCVNHSPGQGTLQARCDAYVADFKSKGLTAFTMDIPAADANTPQVVTQDITGELNSHTSVDAIFMLGPPQAIDAVNAVQNIGRHVIVSTTDISLAVLQDVQAGKILSDADQQPYLQGYYAIEIAEQYVQYKIAPAGGISTGPFMVTKANVTNVLAVTAKYPGIRGFR